MSSLNRIPWKGWPATTKPSPPPHPTSTQLTSCPLCSHMLVNSHCSLDDVILSIEASQLSMVTATWEPLQMRVTSTSHNSEPSRTGKRGSTPLRVRKSNAFFHRPLLTRSLTRLRIRCLWGSHVALGKCGLYVRSRGSGKSVFIKNRTNKTHVFSLRYTRSLH